MSDRSRGDSLPMVVPQDDDDDDPPIVVPAERPARRTGLPRVFRDRLFTSRVLILPSGRQLQVAKGCVVVSADDSKALAFLQARDDFEPQQE